MRKNLLPWSAAAAAAVSLATSSCTYDPHYSSVGGYYNSGYGDGYGYGGSNFSTSLFVSTGDARWGYDPYTYCYYDYRSRRYYDPYLYGYYPVGYRPYAVHGVPHPHGWRPGSRYCPPPRTVRDVTVVNYRNRESAYRNSDYSWARQVRQKPVSQVPRETDHSRNRVPSTSSYSGPSSNRSWLNPYNRDSYQRETRGASENGGSSRGGNRPSAQYNPPFIRPDIGTVSPDRYNRQSSRAQNSPQNIRPDFNRSTQRIEPSIPRSRPDVPRPEESRGNGNRGNFQPPQPVAPPAANPPPARNDQPSRGEGRGKLRSLGEG